MALERINSYSPPQLVMAGLDLAIRAAMTKSRMLL